MPYSYQFFDAGVADVVNQLNPSSILDVGPGAGKWATLLKKQGRMITGVEIHEPYVNQFNLRSLYDEIIIGDVCEISFLQEEIGAFYELVLLGDVLEHLTVEQATDLLERLKVCGIATLVLVPFGYEQGECYGNPHEAHKQPELTEALFHARYPGFIKLFSNNQQGVFYRAGREEKKITIPDFKVRRIGTGMIVKNERDVIFKCLSRIDVFSELICIIDTGSTDDTLSEIKRFAQEYGWKLLETDYARALTLSKKHEKTIIYLQYLEASEQDENGNWALWDFGKARNAYVDILDRLVDWLFWVDADDEVLNPEKFLTLDDPNVGVWSAQIVTDKTDNPSHTWIHHRLWKTEKGVRHYGKCHEYPGFHNIAQKDSGVRIFHQHQNATGKEPGIPRNLRILQRCYDEGDRSPRTLFYLANTLRECLKFQEATDLYTAYLQTGGGFHDEVVFAHIYRARCYRFWGMTDKENSAKYYQKALECAFQGLAYDERFSELWMELSYTYWLLKDMKKSNATSLAAIGYLPSTTLFPEKDKYNSEPIRMLSAR